MVAAAVSQVRSLFGYESVQKERLLTLKGNRDQRVRTTAEKGMKTNHQAVFSTLGFCNVRNPWEARAHFLMGCMFSWVHIVLLVESFNDKVNI